ncbi:winged helix-turn-helix domain-containing protein [Trabulsiella odontotermitis]|uniref:winged helix-turn-helix domain-containing protein n=1 Tax=Trabulsiella odontotermitis TaxID=379893 RepID=UPI0006BA2E3F|nr:transcriptional regulator [Trabulsiella odontotermitis]
MLWIINNNIEFRPEKNRLSSVTNPELSVILTTPASRCLTLLLEAAPEVVPQQDFFKKVWEDDGMLVPANTLYQNISIVRRGLRTVGETEGTLIATVPRKGFQIDSTIKVEQIEEIAGTEAAGNTVDDVEVAGDNALRDVTPPPVSETTDSNRNSKRARNLRALLMVLSFIVGALIFQYPWYLTNEKNFFDNYRLYETVNGCQFFSRSDDIDGSDSFQKYKTAVMKTGVDCKKYPWIYFSSSSTAPALSALICHRPYERKSNSGCITLYFRGLNDE